MTATIGGFENTFGYKHATEDVVAVQGFGMDIKAPGEIDLFAAHDALNPDEVFVIVTDQQPDIELSDTTLPTSLDFSDVLSSAVIGYIREVLRPSLQRSSDSESIGPYSTWCIAEKINAADDVIKYAVFSPNDKEGNTYALEVTKTQDALVCKHFLGSRKSRKGDPRFN